MSIDVQTSSKHEPFIETEVFDWQIIAEVEAFEQNFRSVLNGCRSAVAIVVAERAITDLISNSSEYTTPGMVFVSGIAAVSTFFGASWFQRARNQYALGQHIKSYWGV